MRLRHKPWAGSELAACDFFVDDPTLCKNQWQEELHNPNPIHLELGCGKGGFVATLARDNPQLNFLAIDLKNEVLVLAKRKVEELYGERGLNPHSNLRLMSQDIERLGMIFGEKDQLARIYINFCNPWPKLRHAKHRLTHTRQLVQYREWLAPEGEIWFKTDDAPLFEDTLRYLDEAGYALQYLTRDLHRSDFTQSYPTEHEEMFAAQGLAIQFLIAIPATNCTQAV